MNEAFLVALGFGFGFVSGMLFGTLFIGWLAWRAVRGLAAAGARLRESQGGPFPSSGA